MKVFRRFCLFMLFAHSASAQQVNTSDFPFPFPYDSLQIAQQHLRKVELSVYYNVKDAQKLKKPDEKYLVQFLESGNPSEYFYINKKGKRVDTISLLSTPCDRIHLPNIYKKVSCDSLNRVTELVDHGDGFTRYSYRKDRCVKTVRFVTATEGASTLFTEKNEYDDEGRIHIICYERQLVNYQLDSLKSMGKSCEEYIYKDHRLQEIRTVSDADQSDPEDPKFEYPTDCFIRIKKFSLCQQRYEYVVIGKVIQ